MPGPRSIGEIVVWGIYIVEKLTTDIFTVVFRSNDDGLPGPILAMETNVPVARVPSGGMVGDQPEFRYTLTLSTPVFLPPGTYWVEIFNDTSAAIANEFWCWSFGTPDEENGISGFAFAGQPPGMAWSTSPLSESNEVSLQLCGGPTAPVIPVLSRRGLAVLAFLVAVAAIVLVATQER